MHHINYTVLSNNLPYYFNIDTEQQNRLNGIIQLSTSDTRMPVWNTPSGYIDTIQEGSQDLSYNLDAILGTDGHGMLRFHILNNSGDQLPLGMRLNNRTGELYGRLLETPFRSDKPAGFSSTQLPIWNTPSGFIGSLPENTSFSTTFNSSLGEDSIASTVNYYITKGTLPFTFKLNKKTGELSGVAKSTQPNDEYIDLLAVSKPRWVTPIGTLVKVGEMEDVQTSITANINSNASNIYYYITSGRLPWGIRLKKDGTIVGTTNEVINPNDIVTTNNDLYSPIINSNDLGNFRVGDSVNLQIRASAQSSRTISKYFINTKNSSGELPLGLRINSSTGVISGTVSAMNNIGTYSFIIAVSDNTNHFTTKFLTIGVIE